jgi:hypothetical protein
MKKSKEKVKNEVMLELSETILSDLEDSKPLEEIISKCKKLARMRNDDSAIKWFSLELNGYEYTSLPQGTQSSEVFPIALSAGRGFQYTNPVTKSNEPRMWPESVSTIEALISSSQVALENLKPPTNYTPAITKGSDTGFLAGATYVQESYRDVLNSIRVQQNTLTSIINSKKALLSKIRNNVYDYVLTLNLQLRFENITESLFQQTKIEVDKQLQELDPDIMKKFVAAYDRLSSKNSEEWSQAMSSCRNALKAFADAVFPAQKKKHKTKDKRELDVSDIKVKNRLIAYIDKQTKGNKRRLLLSRVGDLEKRIHNIENFLSQGTHEGITENDVNMCIIETYLIIGSLLDI